MATIQGIEEMGADPKVNVDHLMRSIYALFRQAVPPQEKARAMVVWDKLMGLKSTKITDRDIEDFRAIILSEGPVDLHWDYMWCLDLLGRICDTADQMGASYSTLRSRYQGRRGVTPAAARELATFARKRADELTQTANQLSRAAAKKEAADG